MGTRQRFKLSPSALTYTWDECANCFYEVVHTGKERPSIFPAIFNKIDKAERDWFHGKRTGEISSVLPAGALSCEELWVCSEDIVVPGHASACFVRGKLDSLAHFEGGGYGVFDFKTRELGEDGLTTLLRQLQAYAYCLEHPAQGYPRKRPVTHLGFLCAEPEGAVVFRIAAEPSTLVMHFRLAWHPFPWNAAVTDEFRVFLGQVLDVLEMPEPPPPSPACKFCAYRARGMD